MVSGLTGNEQNVFRRILNRLQCKVLRLWCDLIIQYIHKYIYIHNSIMYFKI